MLLGILCCVAIYFFFLLVKYLGLFFLQESTKGSSLHFIYVVILLKKKKKQLFSYMSKLMECVYTFYSHISLPCILCIPSPCNLPFDRNHLCHGHLLSVPKVFASDFNSKNSVISSLMLVMVQFLIYSHMLLSSFSLCEYGLTSSTFRNATSDLTSDYQLCLDET